MRKNFLRTGLALTALVGGMLATVAVGSPASADTGAASATRVEARDDDRCRVRIDRDDDSAHAVCRDLRRGSEVTLYLRCESRRDRYVVRDTERVGRGDRRVHLEVDCRGRADARRAWVDVDRDRDRDRPHGRGLSLGLFLGLR